MIISKNNDLKLVLNEQNDLSDSIELKIMTNKMNEFLNSDEYKAYLQSFKELIKYLRSGSIDIDRENELVHDLETKHLFSSIKLGSMYPKEKD